MRRPQLQLLAVCALALSGCGLGRHVPASGVTLTVTRDFGSQRVAVVTQRSLAGKPTVLQLLERSFAVRLAPDGSVRSIGGVAGGEWALYVNGSASSADAALTSVHPGDRIWWDLHAPATAPAGTAVVGSFPEPFLHGVGGRRFPTTLACAPDASAACARVGSALSAAGVPAATQELGTGSGQQTLGVVVGTWRELQGELLAGLIERGPSASGIYARFAADGHALELLDPRGRVVRTLGAGSGLIAATREGESAPTWVITGTDLMGVTAAAQALTATRLRDRFGLAVAGGSDLPLPQTNR